MDWLKTLGSKPKSYPIKRLMCFICSVLPLTVLAQPKDPFAMTLEELLSARIEVGTRKNDRTRERFLVPVDSFTRQQLANTGFQDLGLALQRLSPSVNRPQPSFGDGTDHVPPFTLRGMEPDQTLVLVNGKRLHQSALVHLNGTIGRGAQSVDLQTIPLEAVEKIEILRDGAAAQYGSDAIAGIINIVLRQDTEWQVAVHTGITDEGDDKQGKLTLSGGWQLSDGFVRLSANYLSDGDTNRSKMDTRPQYFDGDPRNDDPALQNPRKHRYGQPDADSLTLSFNTELALTEAWQAYGFGHWQYRESDAGGFYRRARDNRNVREIYPDGFLPLIAPEITDLSVNMGIKSQPTEGWNWDINNSFGSNRIEYFVTNSLNASLGTASPTSFDVGELRYAQNTFYINASKQMSASWFLALGGEVRYENYQIVAGEPASYVNGGVPVLDGPNQGAATAVGSQVLPGFQPQNEVDQSRFNYAIYFDTEVDIDESWQAQLALRAEDNEDFGSSLDFKLASGYAINEDLFLRLSASTGFRAPSLGQSLFSSIATINAGQSATGTFPVAHPVSMALGAKPLEAEESTHFSAGLSWQVSETAIFTVDWFDIRVDDRIALTGNIRPNAEDFGPDVVAILEQQGVSQARFFSNTFDTTTMGIDVNYTQDYQFEELNLRLEVAYHHNKTELSDEIALTNVLQNVDPALLFDRSDITRFESGQPGNNWNINLTTEFQNGLVSSRLIKAGSILIGESSNDPAEDNHYRSEWIWDIDTEYRFNEKLTFRGGIKNIANNYPDNSFDTSSVFDGPNGILGYSSYIPFGFVGRHYYLQLSYAL